MFCKQIIYVNLFANRLQTADKEPSPKLALHKIRATFYQPLTKMLGQLTVSVSTMEEEIGKIKTQQNIKITATKNQR